MKHIFSRLTTHVAAIGAAGALGAAAPHAGAAIVFQPAVNITIPSTTAGVYLNVVTGAFSSTPSSVPGWDVNLWGSSALNVFSPIPGPGGGGAYVGTGSTFNNIFPSFAVSVGPTDPFTSPGTATLNPGTPWNLNSPFNGIGFRFINEQTGGQVHYGFMSLSLSATPGSQPRLIADVFYESVPGQALVLPSSGAAGLLASAVVVSMNRRRACGPRSV